MDVFMRTALYYAIYAGNLTIVKLLIENGANLNIKNSYGLTPLDFSALFIAS